MRYFKVPWHHDLEDEPATLFSECDDDGWELRKVEIWRDGRTRGASKDMSAGDARLGEVAMPGLHEISEDRQFVAVVLSNFERAWRVATDIKC